jgi:predicted enzyme related to lactoylglutathione lyase
MADAPLATFKDLCLDAVEPERLGPWWAGVLGLRWQARESGDGAVIGPTPGHTIWICRVPEAKTVKQRVHLDIYTRALGELEAVGSVVVEPQHQDWGWTIMADPEGGEFCAFVRDELPAERLHGLVVDSVKPWEIAQWWSRVYRAEVVHHEQGYSTVQNVPGMPILTMDFVPVPEPKSVKNRIHWDVCTPDPEALRAAGATVLRPEDDEIGWTVMADPEGNEFCAFPGALTGQDPHG